MVKRQEEIETYDPNTELIKERMGMNVTLVLLLARDKRKDVAADTGEEKLSYSSEKQVRINYLQNEQERAGTDQQIRECNPQDQSPILPV